MAKAKIVFEDGTVFEGKAFGAAGECHGEVVFNTSLTGYQEILTDPSYRGQIVTMTYPLIGNYGVNEEDVESRNVFLSGFIIKELSRRTSNWRCTMSLDDYLKKHGIMGVQGVDTRAITRHIRLRGAMKAVMSATDLDTDSLVAKARQCPGLENRDLVSEVTIDKPYVWSDKGRYHVVVLDCGVKHNIMRCLTKRDCRVTVAPYSLTADQIMGLNPDGVMLANGPGDPAAVAHVPATLRTLLGKLPIFGICLGHQMFGLALGGKTFKLKFGHHGANHPVKDLKTGKIAITVQNHGFCVDIDSIPGGEAEITHVNLNDNTLEGMRHLKYPAFSVQFHPEAAAGPHDAEYLFDEFVTLIKNHAR